MASRTIDPLREYLTWLQDRFADTGIPDERTLSETVEIRRFALEGVQTLLQSLGYDHTTVQANCPIQAGSGKVYADFVVGDGDNVWVLELKSPEQNCGNMGFVAQLQDYMVRYDTPIGALFNGREAAVYVNPRHRALKSLAGRADELKTAPCSQDAVRGCQGTALLFSPFRHTGSVPDVAKLARKLAKALPPQPKGPEIHQALESLLQSPTEELASAVIGASPALLDLGATPESVMEEWPLAAKMKGRV